MLHVGPTSARHPARNFNRGPILGMKDVIILSLRRGRVSTSTSFSGEEEGEIDK